LKAFWSRYRAKLTPVGAQQLWLLGSKLHDKYIAGERLLDPKAPDLPSRVKSYTTNEDRTLMSAQSLLLGMFPSVSVGFVVDEDGEEPHSEVQDGPSWSASQAAAIMMSSSLTVCLSVKELSPLLHGRKGNPVYKRLEKKAMAQGKFIEWAQDPKYVQLVEKLWRITGLATIAPYSEPDKQPVSILKRLAKLATVASQIAIERAHQMALFLNPTDEELEVEDEELIFEVSDYIYRALPLTCTVGVGTLVDKSPGWDSNLRRAAI
jgi:hypothetical protein